jgi:hypothetical protein
VDLEALPAVAAQVAIKRSEAVMRFIAQQSRQQAENQGRRMSWHAVSIRPKADFRAPHGVGLP